MESKKFNALTGLRAVAAIMVFLYHNRKAWFYFMPRPGIQVLNELHTGVSVFFVLSGFLIAYTYGDRPTKSGSAYRQYILVRLARIYPVYVLLLSAKFFHLGFPPATETTVTYTLAQGLFDAYSLSGIPQAWTLTTEFCFYLIAPFIVIYAMKNIYKTFLFLTLSLLVTMGAGWLLHVFNLNKTGFLYDPMFVLNTVFTGRFVEFYAGVLLALYMSGKITIRLLAKIRYQTLTGGISMLAIIYCIGLFQKSIWMHGIETYPGLLLRNILFPIAVVLFIHGLIREKTWVQWLLSNRVAVLMGNASFIFYLIHINYINNELWMLHRFPDRNFILLWLISILTYWFVEKPLYNGLKKKIRK